MARWTAGRPAGGERDERHIRRPQSRHRLRHLDETRREEGPPTRAGSWGAVRGLRAGSASAAFRSRASGVDVELGESDLELTSLSRAFRNRDEGDFGLTGGGFACQYGASRKTWTAAGQSAWSYCEWS